MDRGRGRGNNGGGRGGGRGGGGGYGGGGRGGGGNDGGGRVGGRGGRGYDGGGRGGGGDAGFGRDFQRNFVGDGGGSRGRGFDRGGGRGRGRSTTIVRFEKRLPDCIAPTQTLAPVQTGWKKNFSFEKDSVNKLPLRRPETDPKKANNFVREITILLNHFPVNIRFPKIIHQYRIDIERMKINKPPATAAGDGGAKKGGKKGGGKPGGGGGRPGNGGEEQKMLPAEVRKKVLMYLIPNLQREYGREYGIITDFSAALYSVDRLEKKGLPMEVEVSGKYIGPEEDEIKFLVKISATAERVDTTNLKIDVNNMKGIECPPDLVSLERIYSVLMRCVNINKYTPMRRSDLIDYTTEPHPLGGGVVSYPGYNVLLPITNGWKKFINIEIANLAAYMGGSVLAALDDVFSGGRQRGPDVTDVSRWCRGEFDKATDLLKTCKVTYNPQQGKTFSKVVVRVCPKSVSDTKFDCNGTQTSVYDYFQHFYGLQLKYPKGPLLECKGNNSPKIPAEICTLKTGQSFNRKLNDSQTTNIAQVARKDPLQLQGSISKAVEQLNLNANDLFNAYGMKLENGGKMHEVRARVLTPPELCYGKDPNKRDETIRAVITPQDGVWDIWGTDFEFLEFENIAKWGIMNLSARAYKGASEEDAEHFSNQLSIKARSKGMTIPKHCLYREADLRDFAEDRDRNVEVLKKELSEFRKVLNDEKMSFVLVILPKKGCQVYNHVKQAAELFVGILTQCVVGSNINAGNRQDSILGNILLKINSKLNKVNHVVLAPPDFPECFKLFNSPVMILGADVTHPPPGTTRLEKDRDGKLVEVGPPSFAAITASIDRTGMPYMMHIQAQTKAGKGAAEVITGLDAIVKKFLLAYRAKAKAQPQKIIYFRDGVGDGQFQEVLRTEMSAIRQACASLHATYQPRITFVTVQKRHKTRFFISNSSENAPPGTVVDSDIIHPVENDFYLLSHKGLLGTSRPTRYHVLWDDSDFSSNEIQIMAYFLCYMFVRCNRSVKVPAPTYYAHWAAKRAEVLSKGWCEELYGDIGELNRRLAQRETVNSFAATYPMHFV